LLDSEHKLKLIFERANKMKPFGTITETTRFGVESFCVKLFADGEMKTKSFEDRRDAEQFCAGATMLGDSEFIRTLIAMSELAEIE
jgi:hypothetical protein